MDLETFKEAVKLCLEDSYFVYNGIFYYQICGSPMGAPISSALANLAMEVILERITNLLPFDIPFMYIFVDDILTAIPEGIVGETLEIFNLINPKIQFTIELENDRKIPFLDLKIARNSEGSITTEFYQKPCASGRILKYYSNHATSLKVNTAIGLIKRIFTFKTNKSDKEKKRTVLNILRCNKFPRNLINKLICEHKNKSLITPLTSGTPPQETGKTETPIRFIRGLICRKIKSFADHLLISAPHERSLGCFFTKLKDKTPTELQSQLIYKVPCLACLKYYLGMT
jgi:hypothetical protein